MAGVVQPIEVIYKGESKTLRFTVLDDDETKQTLIDGAVYKGGRVDISGATVEFEVNYPVGPPYSAVISKTTADGIVLADQTNASTRGDLSVTLFPADTATLVAKLYKYDVWMIIAGYRRCIVRASDFPVREPVNGP